MNVTRKLNYDNIIEKYLPAGLDGKIVMDFISFNEGRTGGTTEFYNWKDDFRNKKIPFVITRDVRLRANYKDEIWYTLWKEQVVFTPYQTKQANFEIFDYYEIKKGLDNESY